MGDDKDLQTINDFTKSGKTIAKVSDLVPVLNMNNLRLDEDIITKVSEYIDEKITVKNVTTFFQLAKLYKLTSLRKITLSYIERCFQMVVDSPNFLELEHGRISKILTSSELSVHSELEVFNA